MRIGYGRPQNVTWTVSGSGAAILSSTAELDDDRPDTLTALRWISGTQNTSSVFRLRADWTSRQRVGVVGFSNLLLPAGTKITAAFRRFADPSGTYPYTPAMLATQQKLFAGIHGERTAWLLPVIPTPDIVGVEFRIWNDVNGASPIVASSTFHAGEAWISDSVDLCPDVRPSIVRPMTTTARRFNGASYPLADLPRRESSFALRKASQRSYFGSTGADLESIIGHFDQGQVGLFILQTHEASGAYSPQLAHRYAIIGDASSLPTLSHSERRRWESSTMTIVERPIPV